MVRRIVFPKVVAFAGAERTAMFVEALAAAGFATDLFQGDRWLCDPASRDGGPVIVFLSGPLSRRTLARLCDANATLWQGVVDAGHPPAPTVQRLLAGRLLSWPRDRARLLRWLAQQESAADGMSPGAATPILERFARLNLVGRSPAFLASLQQIQKTARTVAPVLLQGATGTGKELAARAIHYTGPRQGGPFVPVNCGAIPDSLLESELFGFEKGAFTDAKEARTGMVEQANGGTLFLDEINSLSSRGQVVLLRFLQDQQFRPLGARAPRQADVRIVAATNSDLRSLVRLGGFREDLMFRLAILVIGLPPLRERPGDIELLAQHFLRRMSAHYGEPIKVLSDTTRAALRRYPWPGNVRELENFIHRVFVMSDGPLIEVGPTTGVSLERATSGASGPMEPEETFQRAKARVVADFEHRYLSRILDRAGGNVTQAAKLAGTERRVMGKLLKKHGLRPGSVSAARAT